MPTPFGMLNSAARDDVAVTVTPVVNFLNITTQGANGVVFIGSLLNPPVNNGLLGMTTVGQNNNLGAIFDAQVVQRGATGSLAFIQNIGVAGNGGFPGFVNGFAGGPANGLTFTAGSRLRARNWMFVDPRNGRRVQQVLDLAQRQLPPPPDYRGLFRPVPTGNPDLLQITAQDGPNTTTAYPAPATAQFLTNIAVQYNFRVYLVWRFGNAPNTIIYTLATNDWNVVFRADTFVAGQGVTRITPGSGVFSPNPMDRNNHADPIVVRPTGNESVRIR